MGYSIRTEQHRYSEWVKFNLDNFTADWKKTYGRELYDHLIDPAENMNLVDRPDLRNVINILRKQLILGWRYVQ